MLEITIKNVNFSTTPSGGSPENVLLKMFSDIRNLDKIREGGILDNTTFCVCMSSNVWAKVERNSPPNTSTGTIKISIGNNIHSDESRVKNARRFVRAIRNYCEREEFETHGDVIPTLSSYTIEGLIHSDLADELVKAWTPTKGFSNKQFVKNHPDEPFLVLLGRDPQAPALLEQWATLRKFSPDLGDKVKAADVMEIARAMREYRMANPDNGINEQIWSEAFKAYAQAYPAHP